MQLVIPKEFVSDSAHAGKYDVKVPTVGDLVNRRTQDRFPFITMDAGLFSQFDADQHPELSEKYCCMTVQEGVFEMKANAVDILTGRCNGHTEVFDLQDIRAGCSAYIAGQVIPRDELLKNGGMMYQYTKYLTSDAPMVDSMADLVHTYQPDSAGRQSSGRDMRDLDAAISGMSHGPDDGLSL